MTKLIDRCFGVIDRMARLPNEEDEKSICEAMDDLGLRVTGKRFFPLLKHATLVDSNEESFPEWMLDYMGKVVAAFPKAGLRETSLFINSYKSEFYRAASFNFLVKNRSVFRLTDELAEYIDDLRISRVNLSEITFPADAFTVFFRMNNREFAIMIKKDEFGIRMTGVNTTINADTEPAFASHVIMFDQNFDLDKLTRIEKDQWVFHKNLTEINYDLSDCRGLEIIQHRMRAFVMKFLFLYNTKFLDKKHETESIKKAKLGKETIPVSQAPYRIGYVSLGIRERERMTLHREVMAATRSVGERTWTKPWWPVAPHIRRYKGVTIYIEGYFAYRKAGMISKDIEKVFTL